MEFEYAGILIIPAIVGILDIIKQFDINAKIIPVLSLIIGLAFGIVLFSEGDLYRGIIVGIYLGLSAVGLYSGSKNINQVLLNQEKGNTNA